MFFRISVGILQTNCYILYDDNKIGVVVDPGGDSSKIIDCIKDNKLNIKYVILTHVHFDHFLAAVDVIKVTGADFLVPKFDEPALSDSNLSLMNLSRNKQGTGLKADRLLDEGNIINAGELELSVLYTPGHTKGSICLICKDILITGDTLFASGVGRTDFPSGDIGALNSSIKRLSELEGDYTVLPGHGPSTTLMAEKQGNPYMNSSEYDFDY